MGVRRTKARARRRPQHAASPTSPSPSPKPKPATRGPRRRPPHPRCVLRRALRHQGSGGRNTRHCSKACGVVADVLCMVCVRSRRVLPRTRTTLSSRRRKMRMRGCPLAGHRSPDTCTYVPSNLTHVETLGPLMLDEVCGVTRLRWAPCCLLHLYANVSDAAERAVAGDDDAEAGAAARAGALPAQRPAHGEAPHSQTQAPLLVAADTVACSQAKSLFLQGVSRSDTCRPRWEV